MSLDGDITEAIVSAVADQKGIPEEELPPLYESINADALEDLFEHPTATDDSKLVVEFRHAGCEISIQDSDDISIEQ